MSKVAIQGNASGTGVFTIASPNSNTDRTLTLPDEAGTVLTRAAGSPDNSVVVDASGNVGVATSSPGSYSSRLVAVSQSGGAAQSLDAPSGTNTSINWYNNGTAKWATQVLTTGEFRWFDFTASATRLTLDSSGNLLVGKTVSTSTVNGFALTSGGTLYATSNGDTAEFYRKTSSSGDGVFLTKSDVGGTHNLVGAAYANGTFAAVSDATKKKNVEDARSYLNDVMQVRVVKYNWITDEDETPKELGWIAQEVEQVFPGMVNEMGGSKLLKKEVFLPMLMKCIQELKAINDAQAQTIESLTARVVALEGGV